MSIFEALGLIEGSPMTYSAIRAWEVQLMVELRMSEEEYSKLSLKERARKVCGPMLKEWSAILETNRQIEEMQAKYGKR